MGIWNFGIIGAGSVADFHACAINDMPGAKLIGFCDGGSGRARKMAVKYSCRAFENYQQMLDSKEVDIVTIATPSGFHMEPTVAAAESGKHVICEKPLEITLERIDAMIEAHRKSGTVLGGIFQNRFNDCLVPLREAIGAGRFGAITYVGAYVPWWRGDEYYEDSWHGTWKLDGGGALMNQSIHMVDMLCELGPPIESVQSFAGKPGHPQIEAEDTAVAVLRFTNGAFGVIYGSTASYPGQPKRFEITGTKGTVVYLEDSFTVWQFAEEQPEDKRVREQFGQAKSSGGAADPTGISRENHRRNFKAFIDALDSGEDFCLSGSEARKAVEVVLAIYESAKEQKAIKLN
ncbi:MAG: Gfo/Idh/MocA family oxidoreductase [Planctomycetota bacterium]|nr:MAG: Gfo/Idh/MocA family oxidoreductase [Planctomycetota bacterium]